MNKKKLPHLVTSVTPHRISFAGGATDLPKFYKKFGGSFLNSSIDKFVYVTVKRHSYFNTKFRIMYSRTENKNSIGSIKNDIVRNCLKYLKFKSPILIFTSSDIPTSSGLGSSSAFTVGLLNALNFMNGKKVSKRKLAEDACKIEIELMKKNCGIQDQYAAAIGGINKYTVNKNGKVNIFKLKQNKNIKEIFDNLILVETKKYRSANKISKSYKFEKKVLVSLKKNVPLFEKIISEKKLNLREIGIFLNKGWSDKKKLSNKVSHSRFDKIYNDFIKFGAYGGKLVGAGGGGFFLFVMPKIKQKKIYPTYKKHNIIKIKYQDQGSKILNKLYV